MGGCADELQEFPLVLGWFSVRYNLHQVMLVVTENRCLEGLGWVQKAGLAAGSVLMV